MKNNIRAIRRQRGMTQDVLAKAAHISRPFLSTVETGAASLTIERASAIADALGCTLNDLVAYCEDGKDELNERLAN